MILGINLKWNDLLIVLGWLFCWYCCFVGILILDGVGGGMKWNLRVEICICLEV